MQSGLVYLETTQATGKTTDYWREDIHYSFSEADEQAVADASAAIFDMCIEAGDFIVKNPAVMKRMGIPKWAFEQVIYSWNEEPAYGSVYGRFDLRFGGTDHADEELRVPQLYEFNADTVTCLVESAWTQWQWFEELFSDLDATQSNYIWELLIKAWDRNLSEITAKFGYKPTVHFASSSSDRSGEDLMNVLYLVSACQQTGHQMKMIAIESIVLNPDGRFYDADGDHIDVCFKLLPWEMMLSSEYGKACIKDMAALQQNLSAKKPVEQTIWIEPIYKMLWANKGLLAVLWQLFGDDQERSKYLIPSWFSGDQPGHLTDFARKPLLSREGADVELHLGGKVEIPCETGQYGREGYVYQRYAPPPKFDDFFPIIGSWMIDGDYAGLCVREGSGPVTGPLDYFAPHIVRNTASRSIPAGRKI